MKKVMTVLLLSLMGLFGTLAWAGSAREDTVERLQSSVDVLHAIMGAPDKGIPEEVLSNAKCILVVPNLIKGGFIFGGKHGRGVASCRTSNGWSAPALHVRPAVLARRHVLRIDLAPTAGATGPSPSRRGGATRRRGGASPSSSPSRRTSRAGR